MEYVESVFNDFEKMNKESIDQIYECARHGDVFAQALLGQIIYEGKYVQKDDAIALGWLRNAAQCNCLFAKELINEYSQSTNVSKGHPDPMEQLNGLIGLERVKTELESLRNLVKVQIMRQKQGLPNTSVSYHCVFSGNPGTGKTTVARIVAGIYKELGILKKGHLVETDRSGLCGEYVGQTAPKTNAKIDEALDGVLFIDEAYTLAEGGDNDYGKEAIATLLKRMEDDRERLVVILAGYTDKIQDFIDSNPGLQSRFNRYIEFDDYSEEELLNIFKSNLKKAKYKIKKEAYEWLGSYITRKVAYKDEKFGNARFVRNTFEKVIQNQANRVARLEQITGEDLTLITIDDVKTLV